MQTTRQQAQVARAPRSTPVRAEGVQEAFDLPRADPTGEAARETEPRWPEQVEGYFNRTSDNYYAEEASAEVLAINTTDDTKKEKHSLHRHGSTPPRPSP